MKVQFLFLALFLFVLAPFSPAQVTQTDNPTQDSTKRQLYLVTKTDGAEFYGYILSDDGREILLETKTIGNLYISKADIKLIKKIDDQAVKPNGELKYTDFRTKGPFTTRYYFTTNGLPIEKDENYALINIYGPEIHFAVKDNLSLGVMASWIASPIALAAKYSFYSSGNTHFSAGTILSSSGYLLNAKGYGGLHWLTATKGDRISSVSLSLGYAYADLDNFLDIGEKYFMQTGNYSADIAISDKLYGTNVDYDDRQLYRSFSDSYVIGLSGITPVGKKASFILDAMAFLGKTKEVKYTNFPVTVTYNDFGTYRTQTFQIGRGEVVDGINQTTLILMPAMRFNTAYNKAFQVALAGVINIQGSEVNSFPIPTVGWLRQF